MYPCRANLFTVSLLVALSLLVGCQSLPDFNLPVAVSLEPSAPQLADKPDAGKQKLIELIDDQQYGAAEAWLLEAIQRHPEQLELSVNLGLLYAATNRNDEALALLTAVTDQAPGQCEAQVKLAQLYRQQYDIAAAASAFEACLNRQPDHPAALLNYGILSELYRGDWQLAVSLYERYQQVMSEPEPRVAVWIADLSRRLASDNQLAGTAP